MMEMIQTILMLRNLVSNLFSQLLRAPIRFICCTYLNQCWNISLEAYKIVLRSDDTIIIMATDDDYDYDGDGVDNDTSD